MGSGQDLEPDMDMERLLGKDCTLLLDRGCTSVGIDT